MNCIIDSFTIFKVTKHFYIGLSRLTLLQIKNLNNPLIKQVTTQLVS